MRGFKEYLTEAFSTKDMNKAEKLIVRVLERKTGLKFRRFPGVERFKSGSKDKFGLRYFLGSSFKSVRFNWTTKHGSEIESIDVWDGNGKPEKPTINIDCRGISIVRIIPKIADLIKSPQTGTYQVISEAAKFGPLKAEFLELRGVDNATYKQDKALQKEFQRWKRKKKKEGGSTPSKLSLTPLTVSKGKIEVTQDDSDVTKSQAILDKIPTEQLFDDLANLVKMVIKGNAPSLLVTGMPGSGKCVSFNTDINIDVDKTLFDKLNESIT